MKRFLIVAVAVVSLFATSCSKNGYYKDSGVTSGKFNGTVMDYLKSKPEYFDSIVRIIRIAGLENTLQNEEVTFFAPADSSVRYLFRFMNNRLMELGKPEITAIDQVTPRIWKKYMSRYVFKFKKGITDFPQVDFSNLTTYAGQIYPAVDGTYMNIGVVYDNVVLGGNTTVPYAGYRYLTVSYLSSQYNTRDYSTWRSATVASVNIETNNGYVHALRYPTHDFGFDRGEFIDDVAYNNF